MIALSDALYDALLAVEATPAGPGRDTLLDLLGAVAPWLPKDESELSLPALQERVELVVLRAVVLATDGELPPAALAKIALLASAARAPREEMRLLLLSGPPSDDVLLIAARGEPALREVRRLAYTVAAEAPSFDDDVESTEPDDEPEAEERIEVPADLFEGGTPALHLVPPADREPSEPREVADAQLAPFDPADMPEPPRPPVALVEPEPPLAEADLYDLVVDDALDGLRGLARDRWELPAAERPSVEQRLLTSVDAIAITGDRVVERVLGWWGRAVELPGAWCSWIAPFTLGCLAGADALVAVLHGLERLPPDALPHASAAADALATAPHPARSDLAKDLFASPHPLARAVGIDLLGRARELSPDQLRRVVLDANIPAVAAAVRAAGRLSVEEAAPVVPALRRWLHFPDAGVAWPVARTLLRWGFQDPIDEIRAGGMLARTLGLQALEVLVLSGDASDGPCFTAIASRFPPSRAQLSALARFGDPGAWARLLHALGDENLADAAVDALLTLLGPCVPPAERLHAHAWRSAMGRAMPAPDLRYRRGEPWSPRVIADECLTGDLSCAAIEGRFDELTIRAGLDAPVELGAFWPRVAPALEAACDRARRLAASYPEGSYRVR